VLRL
jgi:hypothetical protein